MPELTFIQYENRRHGVRALNDQLRSTLQGCKTVVTANLDALGPVFLRGAIDKVRAFDFPGPPAVDCNHDYGAFDHLGERVVWRFAHYDRDMHYGSEDPTDRAVTVSVLTIMLVCDD